MNPSEFPSNSKNVIGKEDRTPKKIEKVVTGEVITRPKSISHRLKGLFFGGEFRNVARYIAGDVLIPALRNLLVDTTTEGIKRAVYGESRFAQRRPTEYGPRATYNPSYRNYSNPIDRAAQDPRGSAYLPKQPPHGLRDPRSSFGEIILHSREDAETVVERLIDIIDKYDVASVADLYDLIGRPSIHVDNKWGWSVLANVSIRQVREGYLIDLPPVEAI